MPPWENVEEVRSDPTLEDGSERIFRFPMGPIKLAMDRTSQGVQSSTCV